MRTLTALLAATVAFIPSLAGAATLTGEVYPKYESLVSYQQLRVGETWYLIGCGPDSDLSTEMREYLDDHMGRPVTISGDVVDDPHWGTCIANPVLVGAKPSRDTAATKTHIPDWLSLPEGLTDAQRETFRTAFTNPYWDTVYEAAISSFLDVCRYFHEHGFTVEVTHRLITDKDTDGTEGVDVFTVTATRSDNDWGIRLPLMVTYNLGDIAEEFWARVGNRTFKSVFDLGNAQQTEQVSRGSWRPLSSMDWFVILKAIIEQGYVQESKGCGVAPTKPDTHSFAMSG